MDAMVDLTDFFTEWRDRIKDELSSFSDPGSTVEVNGSARRLSAAWTMRGAARDAAFTISRDRGVTVRTNGQKLPYRGFVAGPDMADLRYVAQMILKASERRIFVSTSARLSDDESRAPRPALEVLTDLIDEDADATRVAMITGEAGAGKTRVLQELVRRQAERYLQGRTDRLLLYVNAQGRALARLNEALATELQDLRVGLTYHSISVLARLGILIPVIDGFDELLGVSGYADAFGSLTVFLDQLHGEGRILASARSIYYEEEFQARASRASAPWQVVPVAIEGWSKTTIDEYLNEYAKDERLSAHRAKRLRDGVSKVFQGENSELRSKPLFFVKTVDRLREDPKFPGGKNLLKELVVRLIEREQQEKLLDRHSKPLLTVSQLDGLMRELAEEMWSQETRELDSRSVRELAEMAMLDEDVSDSTRQEIVARMATLACLAPGARPGSIAFEHDLFFFFFLAEVIASQLFLEKDLQLILSRSALAEDVADRVALQLLTDGRLESVEQLQQLLDQLAEACVMEWRRTAQVRENAGLIAMALLRVFSRNGEREIAECTIRSLVFPGGRLSTKDATITLVQCRLLDLEIRRTDLVGTRFVSCEARNVSLVEPLVDSGSTRLELDGLAAERVTSLRVRGKHGELEKSYSPIEIADTLRDCGAPIAADSIPDGSAAVADPEIVELLNRLMRVYSRANPVCMDHETMRGVIRHPRWKGLEKLLRKHHIVEEPRDKEIHSRRKKIVFLRRQFPPEQIMAGLRVGADVGPNIRAFWREIETKATSAPMTQAG